MIIQVCKLIASEYGRHKVLDSVLIAQTSGAFFLLDEFETKKNPQFCLSKSFGDGSINLNNSKEKLSNRKVITNA